MKTGLLIALAVLVTAGIMYLGGLAWGDGKSSKSTDLSPADVEAVKEYADKVLNELDSLYAKFEQGELQAKQISDEGSAPYNMAIGYMAEVRKTIDEIEDLDSPRGAGEIQEITLDKLNSLKDGLDEIASKSAADVSLADPEKFYSAYLDVLIEIPELKQEILELTR